MVDFLVGKAAWNDETFLLAAQTDAARDLCNKVLPSDGSVKTDASGNLIITKEHILPICSGILGNGLTMEDMK